MANEYVTLPQLRSYLGITTASDTGDDALLTSVTSAASRAVDAWCGQIFYTATLSAQQFLATDTYCLYVDPFSSTTGLIVQIDYGQDGTYETTLTIGTQFIVEPYNNTFTVVGGVANYPFTRIRLVGGSFFPNAWWGRPQVQVTATWGWSAVPDPVYMATLQVAGEMWKRKDAPFGVLDGAEFGPIRLSADAMKSVSSLLNPYRTGSAVAAMA